MNQRQKLQAPFSRFGSYLSVQTLEHRRVGTDEDGKGIYLCGHVSRGRGRREIAGLRLLDADGTTLPTTMHAEGERLVLGARGGSMVLCFDGPDTLRLVGDDGLALELRSVNHPWVAGTAYRHDERRWVLNATPNTLRLGIDPIVGHVEADAPWEPGGNLRRVRFVLWPDGGRLDIGIDYFQSTWLIPPRDDASTVRQRAEADFELFAERLPNVPAEHATTRTLAARTLWSSGIAAYGLLKRPTILMSKVVMDQVWSWDHCFNAIALSAGHPELAWDQLMVVLDHQDEHGALPDAMSALFKHYNYAKPPVHGWAVGEMLKRRPDLLDEPGRVGELRKRLGSWTNWWLTHRRRSGGTLPFYPHGNDSGWDNSTMFDEGVPLVAPDLVAFIVLQLEAQAMLARREGDEDCAEDHAAAAAAMLEAMINELWRDDRFMAKLLHDDREVDCQSLVPLVPLVLGRRLPANISRSLVERLPAFLTDHGLATERPDSPKFETNGYWRGPIWAPSTMLIVSGLRDLGEDDLADTIAERFCRTCANGMAENFEAMTGRPLCDPAYTWTAAAMLCLGEHLPRMKHKRNQEDFKDA